MWLELLGTHKDFIADRCLKLEFCFLFNEHPNIVAILNSPTKFNKLIVGKGVFENDSEASGDLKLWIHLKETVTDLELICDNEIDFPTTVFLNWTDFRQLQHITFIGSAYDDKLEECEPMVNLKTLTIRNAVDNLPVANLVKALPNLKEVRISNDGQDDVDLLKNLHLFGEKLKALPMSLTTLDDPPSDIDLNYFYNLLDLHIDFLPDSSEYLSPTLLDEYITQFKSLKSCALTIYSNWLPTNYYDKIISLTLDAPEKSCLNLQTLTQFSVLKKLVLNVKICGCVYSHYRPESLALESLTLTLSEKYCVYCIDSIISASKNLKYLDVKFTRLGNSDQLTWLQSANNITEFKIDLSSVLEDTTEVYKSLKIMNGLTSLKLKLRNMFDICCFVYAMPKLSSVKDLDLTFKCPLTAMEILTKIEDAFPILENLVVAMQDNTIQYGFVLGDVVDCFPKTIRTICIPPIQSTQIEFASYLLAHMFRSHLKLNWISIGGKIIDRPDIERCDPPNEDGFAVTKYHWYFINTMLEICSYKQMVKKTM